MPAPTKQHVIRDRSLWLASRGLSIPQFAKRVGHNYTTVYKWFDEGRTPINAHLRDVHREFPDWPV